jgi:hypothetical protein
MRGRGRKREGEMARKTRRRRTMRRSVYLQTTNECRERRRRRKVYSKQHKAMNKQRWTLGAGGWGC